MSIDGLGEKKEVHLTPCDYDEITGQNPNNKDIVHITVAGPVGLQKTLISNRIAAMMKQEFNVRVVPSKDMTYDRSGTYEKNPGNYTIPAEWQIASIRQTR